MDKRRIGLLSINDILILYDLNNKYEDTELRVRYKATAKDKIKKLKRLGYIDIRLNVKENINKQTIPVLKELLKKHNLETKGNKNELAERVLGNIDYNELVEQFPKNTINLTDKGNRLINKYYALIYMNNSTMHYSEDLFIKVYKQARKKQPYQDAIFTVLNKEYLNYFKQLDINKMQLISHYKAHLFLYDKLYPLALEQYFISFRLSICGIWNKHIIHKIETVEVPDVTRIREILEIMAISPQNIADIMHKTEKQIMYLPFNYFNTAIATQILFDLIKGNKVILKNYKHNKLNLREYERKGWIVLDSYI